MHQSSLTLEQITFDNRYASLPREFHDAVTPEPVRDAHLVSTNPDAAALIDLSPEQFEREDFVDYFTGVKQLPGSKPIAMCYSGHQFGYYVPRLGDGRAILLGQVRNQKNELWDLHVKGSGQTKFSRQGDGRAVLRSSIREYLCSEAMYALGIPTTRALCLIGSREPVVREQIEPGAMVVRMAPSHVRFGSFEYFYHTGQHHYLKQLADYILEHFLPELAERNDKYIALLDHAIHSTARLIAQWQGVGFAHGVMNSDNMSILGLTLDYGPFGFLDTYQAGFICNHSDHQGRYAFNQQPNIGLFNVSCLAQALLPLLAKDEDAALAIARDRLTAYWPTFKQAYQGIARAKLGLLDAGEHDLNLFTRLLVLMEGHTDFTNLFRTLSGFDETSPANNITLRDMFIDREAFSSWADDYAQRLLAEASDAPARRTRMNQTNPKYVLRNYMAEQAIRLAQDTGDYGEVNRLLQLLKHPFDEQTDKANYATTPPDWAQSIAVSCSS